MKECSFGCWRSSTGTSFHLRGPATWQISLCDTIEVSCLGFWSKTRAVQRYNVRGLSTFNWRQILIPRLFIIFRSLSLREGFPPAARQCLTHFAYRVAAAADSLDWRPHNADHGGMVVNISKGRQTATTVEGCLQGNFGTRGPCCPH